MKQSRNHRKPELGSGKMRLWSILCASDTCTALFMGICVGERHGGASMRINFKGIDIVSERIVWYIMYKDNDYRMIRY